MAGKFTNLMYDNDSYKEQVARSTNPLLYRLDPNSNVNCNKCFAQYGPRGHDSSVAVGKQIDVDSILRGLNKISSKSNIQDLMANLELENYDLDVLNNCDNTLETEYSRFTHPSHDVKGLNVPDLRLGYPLHDPQCNIFENFQINTRLQAKDNHRPTWQIPLDQKKSLPQEKLVNPKKCVVSFDCKYAPFNN